MQDITKWPLSSLFLYNFFIFVSNSFFNFRHRSRVAFEKNKTDVFRIKTHNVGPIKKLRYTQTQPHPHPHTTTSPPTYSILCSTMHFLSFRIEHDNTGMSARWYLDRVTLLDMNRPHLRLFFACSRWLARDTGDGLTVRYLLGSLNPMNIPKRKIHSVVLESHSVLKSELLH